MIFYLFKKIKLNIIFHKLLKMKISSLIIILSIFVFTSCSPTMKPVENAKPLAEKSELAEGKNIFTTSCAKCHDLPNPTEHSSEEWVGIMNSMAPKAKLTEVQYQWVYDYVVSVK